MKDDAAMGLHHQDKLRGRGNSGLGVKWYHMPLRTRPPWTEALLSYQVAEVAIKHPCNIN